MGARRLSTPLRPPVPVAPYVPEEAPPTRDAVTQRQYFNRLAQPKAKIDMRHCEPVGEPKRAHPSSRSSSPAVASAQQEYCTHLSQPKFKVGPARKQPLAGTGNCDVEMFREEDDDEEDLAWIACAQELLAEFEQMYGGDSS